MIWQHHVCTLLDSGISSIKGLGAEMAKCYEEGKAIPELTLETQIISQDDISKLVSLLKAMTQFRPVQRLPIANVEQWIGEILIETGLSKSNKVTF